MSLKNQIMMLQTQIRQKQCKLLSSGPLSLTCATKKRSTMLPFVSRSSVRSRRRKIRCARYSPCSSANGTVVSSTSNANTQRQAVRRQTRSTTSARSMGVIAHVVSTPALPRQDLRLSRLRQQNHRRIRLLLRVSHAR